MKNQRLTEQVIAFIIKNEKLILSNPELFDKMFEQHFKHNYEKAKDIFFELYAGFEKELSNLN